MIDSVKSPERHYIKMGRRYEAFIKLISLLFERNTDQLFENYPMIFTSINSEFVKI